MNSHARRRQTCAAGQPLGNAYVVGIDADTGHDGQYHKRKQHSQRDSPVHFYLLSGFNSERDYHMQL